MKLIRKVHPNIKGFDLNQEPVIIRVNEFDHEAVTEFSKSISDAHNTGQNIIPIIIDSPGGFVHSLLSMISIIEDSNIPVATIIEGRAMSCGAILAMCGALNFRFMAPHSTMMIHSASTMAYGKTQDIETDTAELRRLNDKILQIASTKSGHKKTYLKDLLANNQDKDIFLTPQAAKKHNLIDHIWIPSMTIDLSLKIDLK